MDTLGYPKTSIQISSSLSDPPTTATGIDSTMCTRLDYPSGSRLAHLCLMEPLSSVRGPRSDRCGCCILAARSACRCRWDARGFAILYMIRVAACMPSLSLGRLFLAALRH